MVPRLRRDEAREGEVLPALTASLGCRHAAEQRRHRPAPPRRPSRGRLTLRRRLPPPPLTVEIAEYDEAWPIAYARLVTLIRGSLSGEVVVGVDHVGSTAVPGLPAKPIIDIDLTVADSAREDAYVPELEAAGFST
ncbi:MAG: GrpB family protein [Nocardioides sp.]